jgi:hypothetical protein
MAVLLALLLLIDAVSRPRTVAILLLLFVFSVLLPASKKVSIKVPTHISKGAYSTTIEYNDGEKGTITSNDPIIYYSNNSDLLFRQMRWDNIYGIELANMKEITTKFQRQILLGDKHDGIVE